MEPEQLQLKTKKKKKKPSEVIGVKLITGMDFIGIKKETVKTKNVYEKCAQLVTMPTSTNGLEVRFMPLNIFDSALNKLPYRDLSVPKNFVLYEYLPDNHIINAYVSMITTGDDSLNKEIRH